jgi:hypothetical protein
MSGHEQDTDPRDSTPNSTGPERAAGGMGVSSERVGHTGPGQYATDGIKDTSPAPPVDEDVLADDDADRGGSDDDDRLRGGDEVKPEGRLPVAGYPSLDPRSAEKPYTPAPDAKHSGSTG